MQVINTISNLRAAISESRKRHGGRRNASLGFFPTMGYLHQGHESLMRIARADNDISVLSIFVNPLQFGPHEDFDRYPRNTERDLLMAEKAGMDFVFMPEAGEMFSQYPLLTKVTVTDLTSRLCGASRPGHFDGVATIVCKLFNIIAPDRAYFSMKDAQQVAVIERMVSDLNFPVEIVRCPIIREADGLAMSSRNVYLDAEQRKQAVALSQALNLTEMWIKQEGMTFDLLRNKVRQHIEAAPLASIDYVDILTYPSLQPINEGTVISDYSHKDDILIAVAVRLGHTRLIDNRMINIKELKSHV